MFDLGWTELLLIGIVALIVVGPKDLPGMFKAVGKFVGKAKRMARDFSQAMNDAADDAGVGDVKRTLHAASNPMKSAMDEVKKSTESFTATTMAGPKGKLDPERAEKAEKIRQRAAEMAEERKAAEEKAAAEADEKSGGAVAKAADAKAPAAGKPAAKKPTAKKPAAKSTASKSASTRKTVAKTPAKRKMPTKKPAEDKA